MKLKSWLTANHTYKKSAQVSSDLALVIHKAYIPSSAK